MLGMACTAGAATAMASPLALLYAKVSAELINQCHRCADRIIRAQPLLTSIQIEPSIRPRIQRQQRGAIMDRRQRAAIRWSRASVRCEHADEEGLCHSVATSTREKTRYFLKRCVFQNKERRVRRKELFQVAKCPDERESQVAFSQLDRLQIRRFFLAVLVEQERFDRVTDS